MECYNGVCILSPDVIFCWLCTYNTNRVFYVSVFGGGIVSREDALQCEIRAYRVDPAGCAVIGSDGTRAAFGAWIDSLEPAFGRGQLETLLRGESREAEFAIQKGGEVHCLRARREGDIILLRDLTAEESASKRAVMLEVLRSTGIVCLDYDVERDELTTFGASGETMFRDFSRGEYGALVRATLASGSVSGSVNVDGRRMSYTLVQGDRDHPIRYAGAVIPERLDSMRAEDDPAYLKVCGRADLSPLAIDRWRIERYRLLGEDENTVTFDYDPVKDTLIYSVPIKESGRAEITIDDFLGTLSTNRRIAPESRDVVRNAMLRSINSATSGSYEYRVDFYGAGYQWHRARFVSAADQNGAVYRVVGRADEIEKEMADREDLMKCALTDGVTGLFNRRTAQRLIDHVLSEARDSRFDALFVIDIDDFKRINDTRGHLEGDVVLMAVADAIRAVFREEDIKGRYGGDEFIVYMRAFSDPNLPSAVARRLMNKLAEGRSCASCSVGVTLVTECADFDAVFTRADKALYRAKSVSKSCFSMYGE